MKSLRNQLSSLYSLAGYKATGIWMPCHCQAILHCPSDRLGLNFKIDIAHQLYSSYKEDSFKYNDRGVTPQLIAQEVAIYSCQSSLIDLEIDSFGSIWVTPTNLYYDSMINNILKSNKVTHFPVAIKNLQLKDSKQVQLLIAPFDLSLSSLRVIHNLEMICKKRLILKETDPWLLTKYLDLANLNDLQVELFNQLDLINTNQCAVGIKLPRGRPCINGDRNIANQEQLEVKPQLDLLTGCLRHQDVAFQKINRLHIRNNTQLVLFGETFPDIQLTQLQIYNPTSYKQNLQQILRYSLQFDPLQPISLRQNSSTRMMKPVPSTNLLSPSETILLLLDYLGRDELRPALNYLQLIKQLKTAVREEGVLRVLADLEAELLG